MIEANGLTKRYGDKTAVDGITFTVEPGIVTGFLAGLLLVRPLPVLPARPSPPRISRDPTQPS